MGSVPFAEMAAARCVQPGCQGQQYALLRIHNISCEPPDPAACASKALSSIECSSRGWICCSVASCATLICVRAPRIRPGRAGPRPQELASSRGCECSGDAVEPLEPGYNDAECSACGRPWYACGPGAGCCFTVTTLDFLVDGGTIPMAQVFNARGCTGATTAGARVVRANRPAMELRGDAYDPTPLPVAAGGTGPCSTFLPACTACLRCGRARLRFATTGRRPGTMDFRRLSHYEDCARRWASTALLSTYGLRAEGGAPAVGR